MCEEQTVSLVDVVEEDEELEEEASAVLAGSDSDHCSYPQGYVKRQALYACSSCSPPGGEAAGVCLACSYTCHEGHDLFELYTKRNFRCDCGNNKFSDRRCKLFPDKDEFNTLNKYSQNFFGVYCTCSRPYPDPEDQVEDEMIQCVACEDWLHGRHLGCLVPDSVESHEMICDSCMNKNPFLWTYAAHLAVSGAAAQVKEEPGVDESNKEETGDDVTEPSRQGDDVTEPSRQGDDITEPSRQGDDVTEPSRQGDDITEPSRQGDDVTEPSRQGDDVTEPSRQGDDITEPSCKRSRDDATSSCRLKELEGIEKKTVQSGAVFWPSGWRSKLCSCNTCKDSLSHCSLSFLLDDSDTVLAYENKGKSNEQRRQGHDPLMSALHQLTRVQQLEIIHGYNDMKTELKDFLQRFAAEGKVVTPDDIRQFFENQSQKRRRDEAARFRPT